MEDTGQCLLVAVTEKACKGRGIGLLEPYTTVKNE